MGNIGRGWNRDITITISADENSLLSDLLTLKEHLTDVSIEVDRMINRFDAEVKKPAESSEAGSAD